MAKLEIPIRVFIGDIEDLIAELKALQTYKLFEGDEMKLVDLDAVVEIFAGHVRSRVSPVPDKTFAERLTAEIYQQGRTKRELAEKTGITEVTIGRYTNGERIPKGPAIAKCAKALGVTCDYLLGLSDDPHKTGKQGWT